MSTWFKLSVAALIAVLALGGGWWLALQTPLSAPGVGEEMLPPSVHDAGPPDISEVTEASVDLPALPQPSPLSEALCPQGMAWVQGEHCPAGFLGDKGCRVAATAIGVCVDLFEYPNQAGVLPAAMSTFGEASAACHNEGKRLCRDSEWTYACRGTLELSACQFGLEKPVRRGRLWNPAETASEFARVDGRRRSAPSQCISTNALFDMPGNLEEWVQAEGTGGYEAALKGGHFNLSSIGCERSIYVQETAQRSPFAGFRCCQAPLVEVPTR